jgi:hypothetical protein
MNEGRIQKNIGVTEPEYWYGQNDVAVSLFTLSDGAARIMFNSIDDFMVYQDVSDWSADANLEWAKEYLWDNLPEKVSLDWLYKHGYRPY